MIRIVGALALLVALPLLWNLLAKRQLPREYAVAMIGVLVFAGTFLKTDVALISWPVWPAPDRGIIVGLTDCLAIALIATRRRRADGIPFKWLFGLHATAIAFSILMSSVPMASTFALWQFGRIFLLYFAVAGEVDNPRTLDFLFKGLAIGLMFEAGVVAVQKAQGVVQAAGTAVHQNALAVSVELILMPLLAIMLQGRAQKLLWLGVLAALLVLAGGGSRAGLGLALFGILLTLGLSAAHSMTKRKSKALVGAIVAVCLAVPIALGTLSDRFGSGSFVTQETQRDALEASARAVSADHPFGIGAGTFVTVANTQGYTSRAGVAWGGSTRAAPVHNAYLLERAELGWQGMITFAMVLLVPLFVGLAYAFRKPRSGQGGVMLGAVAALAVVSLHSFFEYVPISYECFALIAVNIGIIASVVRQRRAQGAARRPQPRNGRSAPPEPRHSDIADRGRRASPSL